MAVVTTPAILLRSFPYGETSRILRFLTEEKGLVGVVARGARKQDSKGGSGLDTFAEGTLTFYHKGSRDLQTFKDFAPRRVRTSLSANLIRFAGASLLAELVLKHAGEEASPVLFRALSEGLSAVESGGAEELPGVLLASAWLLVSVLGYRPSLERCVTCGRELREDEMGRFDFSAGGLRCEACGTGEGPRVGPGARTQLRDLLDGSPPVGLGHLRAHLRLLSDFVTYHVSSGEPLRSFRILRDLLPPEEARAPGSEEGAEGAEGALP